MAELNGTFEDARRDTGLSHDELWLRYFALGGMRTAFEVEAILYGALAPTTQDRDLLAVALNERYSELGGNHPIAFSERRRRSGARVLTAASGVRASQARATSGDRQGRMPDRRRLRAHPPNCQQDQISRRER